MTEKAERTNKTATNKGFAKWRVSSKLKLLRIPETLTPRFGFR